MSVESPQNVDAFSGKIKMDIVAHNSKLFQKGCFTVFLKSCSVDGVKSLVGSVLTYTAAQASPAIRVRFLAPGPLSILLPSLCPVLYCLIFILSKKLFFQSSGDSQFNYQLRLRCNSSFSCNSLKKSKLGYSMSFKMNVDN